jgi:hypothetical protein
LLFMPMFSVDGQLRMSQSLCCLVLTQPANIQR